MLQINYTVNDLPFFISKNPFTGDLNLVKDVNAIKQSVKNIIMTIRGERPFNFLLGGNPRGYLFDNLNNLVIINCKSLISNAIATFEPRVILNDIQIYQSFSNPNKINIIIVYRIPEIGITDTVSISIERTR